MVSRSIIWTVLGSVVAAVILISTAFAEQRRNGSTTATNTVSLVGSILLVAAVIALTIGMWSL